MHLAAINALTALAAPTAKTGPGGLMRTVIVVSVVGAGLIAWFVLRGYGNND